MPDQIMTPTCPQCHRILKKYSNEKVDEYYMCMDCKITVNPYTTINQEMNADIPDKIRYQNAPSQNAIDESYKKGYNAAVKDCLLRLKIAKRLLDSPNKEPTVKLMIHEIFHLIDQFMSLSLSEVEQNHHDGEK